MAITFGTVETLPLLSGYDLTPEERKELDYIADASDESVWSEQIDRFFRFHGSIYDTHEFVRIVARRDSFGGFSHTVDNDSPLLEWEAIQTDSFFSAVVLRYTTPECDEVEVCVACS
jgi:hypothetical protein